MRMIERLGPPRGRTLLVLAVVAGLVALAGAPEEAFAHGVAAGDKGYIQEISGVLLVPFAYLGASTW